MAKDRDTNYYNDLSESELEEYIKEMEQSLKNLRDSQHQSKRVSNETERRQAVLELRGKLYENNEKIKYHYRAIRRCIWCRPHNDAVRELKNKNYKLKQKITTL